MSLKRRLDYVAARHLARRPAKIRLDRAIISFSFDDFPKSAATTGARIMDDRGVRATFYASAGNMGRTVDGQRQYDAEDLVRLSDAGHEIGCHTATHARLTKASPARIRGEYASNRDLLRALGRSETPPLAILALNEAPGPAERDLLNRSRAEVIVAEEADAGVLMDRLAAGLRLRWDALPADIRSAIGAGRAAPAGLANDPVAITRTPLNDVAPR